MPETLRITAKAAYGIRRCGIRHLAVPTDHPVEAFEPEQVAVMESDPDLTVERLSTPAGKTDGSSSGDGDPPRDEARNDAIWAAIKRLDPKNLEHFTKGNVPKVEAIEAITGFQVSAGERDTAWAMLTGAGL